MTPEMQRYWKEVSERLPAPHGQRASTIISTPIDSDRVIDRELVACCHCGLQWVWQKGSGRVRRWCPTCARWACGPHCPVGLNCVPYGLYLENIEKGRPLDWTPISVAVPAPVPGGPISLEI